MFDIFDKFASNAEPRNRAPTVRERVYLPAHALDRIRSLTVAALLDALVAPFTKKFSADAKLPAMALMALRTLPS